MLAGFLIGFREALEAALIIGVLISLLYRTRRELMAKWVWGGVVLALIASVLTWMTFEIFVGEFSKKNEELFEGLLYLVAAILITTVILHVIGHASKEILENKAEKGQLVDRLVGALPKPQIIEAISKASDLEIERKKDEKKDEPVAPTTINIYDSVINRSEIGTRGKKQK